MKSIARDLGIYLDISVHTESSVARPVVQRAGIGRARHLDVSLLWVQDELKNRSFSIHKVQGTDNPADMMTKHVEAHCIKQHCERLGVLFTEGRAASAPNVVAYG